MSAEAPRPPMTYEQFAALAGANADGMAHCPGHDDSTPSLQIKPGKNGAKRLFTFKCFAGCEAEKILEAYRITWADIYGTEHKAQEGGKRKAGDLGQLAAEYFYDDEAGDHLFRVLRFEKAGKKTFVQERAHKRGWKRGRKAMEGCRRVLYRLGQLLAAPAGGTVFFVEGEKCVWQLEALGLVATTTAGGAGNFDMTPTEHVCEVLADRHVVILPDRDAPGYDYAEAVARCVHEHAASIRVVALPGLDEGGDVVDWARAGGTREELERLAAEAAVWNGPAETTDYPNCTDLGNAIRFVTAFGENLRYVFPWRKWLTWDRRRWAFDDAGEVARYAARVPQLIYAAAADCDDKDVRAAMIEWGRKTEGAARQAALVELARAHANVVARPGDFDRDPMLLNVRNGTIDLKTGQLRPHRREDLIRRIAPVDYHPDATCPLWLAFLERVLPAPAVRVFFQRAVGYSLTGDISEHALFLLWGTGSNGKTVALERVQEVLGDYGQSTKAETFMEQRSEAIPNALAALDGARFVAISETDSGKRLAEGLVKDFTGGDTVAARFLFAEWFNFRPQFKLWIRTNHKPVIRGTDEGIWRRIKLIPFAVRIPEAERDKQLAMKLRAELPGILAWAIQGCLAWQRDGLSPPAEVRAATAAYRDEQDPLGGWLGECCTLDDHHKELVSKLWGSYTAWCEASEDEPLSKKAWGQRLDDRGIVSNRIRGGIRVRVGIALGQVTQGSGDVTVTPLPDTFSSTPSREKDPETDVTQTSPVTQNVGESSFDLDDDALWHP